MFHPQGAHKAEQCKNSYISHFYPINIQERDIRNKTTGMV